VSPENARAACASLAKPLVFTNGCFDILHRGHVDYLGSARQLGQSLVVALNTDASVQRLNKGSGRPLNTFEARAEVIASLRCVTLVTWFDQDTPIEIIKQINPQFLVKGGDWPSDTIIGAEHVLASGGEVHSIPFKHQVSTTGLIEKIRNE
ncbi:MAG: adenylyltransferase/cytidyltransferase family protein, partial [Proteobacteria bacterium]|nr:adenylyltransferase/cytidyltransferase family protein [Pseudomonadota bacterium]